MSVNATSESLSPVKPTAALRRPGSHPGGGASGFAQMLQLQANPEDDAPDAAGPSLPGAQASADEAAGTEGHPATGDDDGQGPDRKLPRKLQLGAEDLTPPTTPVAPTLTAMGGGGLDRARDLASRLQLGGRHRANAATDTLKPLNADTEATAAAAAGFRQALASSSPDAAVTAPAQEAALDAPPVRPPALPEPTPALQAEAPAALLHTPGTEPAAAPAAPMAQAQLDAPVGSPAFNDALGTQLNLWLAEGVHLAQLELNPRDLGPIEVRIAMSEGQTRVELNAEVSSTREALQQALPQLNEALGDVGLQLAGSGLSDAAQSQGQARQDGRPAAAPFSALAQAFRQAQGGGEGSDPTTVRPLGRPRSLIDLVA